MLWATRWWQRERLALLLADRKTATRAICVRHLAAVTCFVSPSRRCRPRASGRHASRAPTEPPPPSPRRGVPTAEPPTMSPPAEQQRDRRSSRTRDVPMDLTLAAARLNCCAIHKLHRPNPRTSFPLGIFIFLEATTKQPAHRIALTGSNATLNSPDHCLRLVDTFRHGARLCGRAHAGVVS